VSGAFDDELGLPIEPPSTPWAFPTPGDIAGVDGEVVGVGADLAPGTLLAAYRRGLFPMRLKRRGPLGWWSPEPRGVIPLDGFHWSRSLRRSARRYRMTVDRDFVAVMRGCGDRRRDHGWIDDSFVAAYTELHNLGWAHSVEVWTADGQLAGGTYGVAIGGLFAAESMFRNLDLERASTDAGKVAVGRLVDLLRAGGGVLLDVQWATPLLVQLGAVEIGRVEYLDRAAAAMSLPPLVLQP
jgi:leucyl/phenylalanyl-tRNA---protein transferase